MTDARKLRLLDVDRLAEECAEQTARFFSRATHDPGYCYELFRRAIVGRNSYAWEKVYSQYQSLVASWVRRHSGLANAEEEIDFFVNRAFDRMWSAIDAEKFQHFEDVAGLLGYLQTCVHSVIVDHKRNNPIKTVDLEVFDHLSIPNSPSIEDCVTDQIERLRLWQIVIKLMHTEKECIVLKYSFMYGYKPAEIYAAFPDLFENLDAVYRIKRNLLSRLRRNPALRQFFRH